MRAFTLVAFQASLLLAALQCAAAYVPNMPVTHARSGLVRLREPFAAPDPAPAMDDALILLDDNIATPPLWMRCLAESAGTSFLVLGFSLISSLGLGLAASSMAIGLVIATAVSALASVSGAHFNPAITCALTAAGDLRPLDASAYVCSQCAGAFLAAGLASLAKMVLVLLRVRVVRRVAVPRLVRVKFSIERYIPSPPMLLNTGTRDEHVPRLDGPRHPRGTCPEGPCEGFTVFCPPATVAAITVEEIRRPEREHRVRAVEQRHLRRA